ncbi:MAG: translocation/assembly module TamB domain-containing protein [Oxalobacter sp.]|nr:translocation/assembly module TamB domain-containing protein [Oxalobacter sp.]
MLAFLARFRQFWTKKRLLYVLAPLGILFCLLMLCSQRWAIQWIAESVVAAKGEKITFEETSGSLFHELRAEKVVYEGRERDITVKGLVFRWNPLHLLHGKADIDELSASVLEIDLKRSSDEPLKLPESLAPPVSVAVQQVVIDSLSVKKMGVGVTLENIHCSVLAEDGEWQVKGLGFDSPFGNVAIDAALQMEKPFVLSGKARFDNTDLDAHMAVDAGGTLDRIQLSASLNGYGATGDLKAVVTPFAPFIFDSLELVAKDIDPSKIDEGWPIAKFGAKAHILARADRSIEGFLQVENGLSGPVEQKRLPIHAVRATIGGNVDVVELSPLVIDLGSGGIFSGKGTFSEPETILSLKTGGFNLHGITEVLRPTHAVGSVGYHRVEGKQEVTVDLGESHIRLKADVLKSDDLIELKECLLTANGGSMAMKGHLDLNETKDFALKGNISHFNFAALGKLPPSNLNVGFDVSGALKPDWKADLAFRFEPSSLFNQPVSGYGKVLVRGKEVTDAAINLALGANTFTASGKLGKAGGQLDWRLNAPALGVIGHGFKGALEGAGTLSGPLDALQGKVSLTGHDFMLADLFGAHELQLEAGFGTTLSDRIDARLSAAQATVAGTHWASLNLRSEGTWRSHTLSASAKSSRFDLTAQLSGGLTAGGEWVGSLEQLENRGAKPFTLSGSAALRVASADVFSIEDLTLNLGEGRLNVDKLVKKNARLETSGNARNIPLDWLLSFSEDASSKVDSTLTIGGDWSLRADHALSGEAHVYREDGDITLIGEEHRMRLRLAALDLRALFNNSNMDLHLHASSKRLGETDATLKTRLAYRNGSWGLFKDSPLQLALKAEMPSIQWISFLTGLPDLDLNGSLSADIHGTGTLGTPRLSGNVAGHGLEVDWPSNGIHLDRGELSASLEGNRLTITKGTIYGEEGKLLIGGGASMQNGMVNSTLKLHADHLLVMSNVDRQVVLTGDGNFTLDDKGLNLTGNLHVDRAKIVLDDLSGVTRSKDVVVLGRPPKKEATSPFRFTVTADLGNHFMLQGMGVETRLAGQVTASSQAGDHLRLNGNINTVDGVFNAYGQKLIIRKGRATFHGTPDNPSIDVLAVKEFSSSDEVSEVGVQVRGTAQIPKIKLYSKPEIPDSEKLSWLVLGYGGGENGSAQQRSAMAAAAAAILSSKQTGGVPGKLAGALGMDIGVSSSSQVDDTVLALSRRIASNLYLSYEQGLTGAISLIKLRYQISQRMSLVGQTGTITAFDVLYDWRFD